MKKTVKRVLLFTYFTFFATLLTMKNVRAYIDPSAMTYTIQAVAGIAIAVGAGIGIYWRKAKNKVAKKLNIDENKNKTVETDDIVVKKDNK